MSDHTSGPWHLLADGWTVVDGQDRQLAIIALARDQMDESYVNARMMAAAPELLDSCINLVSHLRSLGHPDDPTVIALVDEAYRAIAKAKGQVRL